jgi:hypothetical protein
MLANACLKGKSPGAEQQSDIKTLLMISIDKFHSKLSQVASLLRRNRLN